MPVNAGSAFITILPDMTKFNASLQSSTSGLGKLSSFGNTITKNLTNPLVLAGAAVAGFGVAAVQAASDQEEAFNKAGVIFGTAADEVQAFAETSAESFGISETAALDAAASFGNMLTTTGLTEEAAADMSLQMVELAADLASFNNIDTTEALDKLRSGLAGEAEPLRRLGILLSEARVKQEAYASGIAEVGDELTEAQKVQARYNLIMEDSQAAQGDFERTSDTLANQLRILSAEWEDFKAAAGAGLAEPAAKSVSFLTKAVQELGDAWGAVSDFLDQAGQAPQAWIDTFKETIPVTATYTGTVGELEHALDEMESAGTDVNDMLVEQTAALKELRGAIPGLIGDVLGLKNAQQDLAEAQADSSTTASELKEAQLAVVDAFLRVKGSAADLRQGLQDGLLTMQDVIGDFRQQAKAAGLSRNAIQDLLEEIRRYIQGLNDIPTSVITRVGVQGGPLMPGSPQQLAEGGIVRRPTLAVIGEAGPEAVVPLGKGKGLPALTIHINAGALVHQNDLPRFLRDTLLDLKRRNLTTGL